MSLTPDLPFEFLVPGVPVSLQNKGKRSLQEWKELVRHSFGRLLPEGHWATDARLSVTIFYFRDGSMRGDVDNIVKPILDAMSSRLYTDDSQIERVLVQKFETGRLLTFINPTPALASALEADRPVVHVRLDSEATVGQDTGR